MVIRIDPPVKLMNNHVHFSSNKFHLEVLMYNRWKYNIKFWVPYLQDEI